MPCQPINLGNGAFALVCGKTRRKLCVYCRKPSTRLCDGASPLGSGRMTCDKALCDECATQAGKGTDLCREHAAELERAMDELIVPEWLRGVNVLVQDTETTGVYVTRDRVVQMGMAHFRDGKLVRSAKTLINPECPIPEAATKVHGITNAMTVDAPSFRQGYMNLLGSFDLPDLSATLLVAHNADYDSAILVHEALRHDAPAKFLVQQRWFCTMVLAKALKNARKYDKGFKLTDLCEACGIEFDGNAHDAEFDAIAAGRLFYFLASRKTMPVSADAVYAKQMAWFAAN
jgi:DNA polymerase-3 subunit epsilon